ncbi:hypothetical protein BC941DRAFT_469558 [Chlamydoabsidia padenii]|nr:hypothetical protein BC941DRAFT_469558 [Chlamydoabsidia padenii]
MPTGSSEPETESIHNQKANPDLDYQINYIRQLEDSLDHLHNEWTAIDIVLNSLKTAFPAHPSIVATEDYLDKVDREMSFAYDDLMAQVRSLDRSLRRLDNKIKSCRSSSGSLPTF